MSEYGIGDLSEKSGVSRRNIYFYVQQGLLPGATGAGLAARYGEEHLLRLQAIRSLRQRGMRLDEIRERLGRLDVPGLEKLLAERPQPDEMRTMVMSARRFAIAPPPAPGATAGGQSLVRYVLAPGVELLIEGRAARALHSHVPALSRAVKQALAAETDSESNGGET